MGHERAHKYQLPAAETLTPSLLSLNVQVQEEHQVSIKDFSSSRSLPRSEMATACILGEFGVSHKATPGDSKGQRNLVCSSWGCKRVGHDLATEQKQGNWVVQACDVLGESAGTFLPSLQSEAQYCRRSFSLRRGNSKEQHFIPGPQ